MTAEGGTARPALPAVPVDFHWTTESWGSALRCRPLDDIATHLFTTRQLDLTQSEDVHRLGLSVGVARVVMIHQVHQAHVVTVREGEPTPEGRPQGDVLISNHPDVAIAVRAADCVPILIADRSTGAVAAVHAGWRGTAAKAAMAAVVALRGEFGADPHTMVAAIGPSIGRCCYEVGSELVDAFAAAGHERYLIDRWFVAPPPGRGWRERAPLHLDVAGANRDQLVLAGIPEGNIHVSGLCTAMNLDVLTSFRIEKEQAGRIAGVVVARPL